jgi:hypothetical protein
MPLILFLWLSVIAPRARDEQVTERGHPVRQQAQPAPFSRKGHLAKAARLRAGGQDVRAPLGSPHGGQPSLASLS